MKRFTLALALSLQLISITAISGEAYNSNHPLSAVIVSSHHSRADERTIKSYRCGTRLIQAEMHIYDVVKLCSKNYRPTDIETYQQTFESYHYIYGVRYLSIDSYQMERWTFKQYGRFRTYVIFRNGYVYQILQDRSQRN
ncbi:MAG: DUF2845 domain-containing protein [Methylophagaceae bacterium]